MALGLRRRIREVIAMPTREVPASGWEVELADVFPAWLLIQGEGTDEPPAASAKVGNRRDHPSSISDRLIRTGQRVRELQP
jgi:hypothetical protein